MSHTHTQVRRPGGRRWPQAALDVHILMPVERQMTAVGFEPTPLRTGAWSQRLRPLGQTVLPKCSALFDIFFKTRRMSKSYKTGSTEKRRQTAKASRTRHHTNPHIPGLGALYEIDKTSLNSPIGAWQARIPQVLSSIHIPKKTPARNPFLSCQEATPFENFSRKEATHSHLCPSHLCSSDPLSFGAQ